MRIVYGRNRITPLGVLLTLLLLGQSLAIVTPTAVAQMPDPPNVVFILLDDLDARMLEDNLNFYPNMRNLKAQGTSFSNAFLAVPLCCPSRATILRGQYPHNHGVLQNTPPDGGFETFHRGGNEQSTVATWLKQADYRTALIGKYLNGYPNSAPKRYIPPGWERWFASIGGKFFDYTFNNQGRIVEFGTRANDYETDVLRRQSVNFIGKAARDNAPFFLHLSPHAPHAPATPAPRHKNRIDRARAPRLPSFNESDVTDKPPYIKNAPRLKRDQIKQIDAFYAKKLRSLLAVDDMVGAVVNELRNKNELDNTYIFLMSDNGFEAGEHRIHSGKGRPYDESTRTTLFVRGPGVTAGRVEDRLVLSTDIAPTIADLTGATAAEFVDGRSIAPLLRNEAPATWRQAVLIELLRREHIVDAEDVAADVAPIKGRTPEYQTFRAIRTADWLYVNYTDSAQGKELYDVADDPYQISNLANDPAYADEIAAFDASLETLKSCKAAECVAAENAPVGIT